MNIMVVLSVYDDNMLMLGRYNVYHVYPLSFAC